MKLALGLAAPDAGPGERDATARSVLLHLQPGHLPEGCSDALARRQPNEHVQDMAGLYIGILRNGTKHARTARSAGA